MPASLSILNCSGVRRFFHVSSLRVSFLPSKQYSGGWDFVVLLILDSQIPFELMPSRHRHIANNL